MATMASSRPDRNQAAEVPFGSPTWGAGAQTQGSFTVFPRSLIRAGSEVEHLGWQPVPIWDANLSCYHNSGPCETFQLVIYIYAWRSRIMNANNETAENSTILCFFFKKRILSRILNIQVEILRKWKKISLSQKDKNRERIKETGSCFKIDPVLKEMG